MNNRHYGKRRGEYMNHFMNGCERTRRGFHKLPPRFDYGTTQRNRSIFRSTSSSSSYQWEHENDATSQYIDKMLSGIHSKYKINRSTIQLEIEEAASKIGT